MTFLALMLLVPVLWQGPTPPFPTVEPSAELCEQARELARLPACLAAGDCEAEQLWRRAYGPPGVELAPPAGRPTRAQHALPPAAEEDLHRRLERTLVNCPAGPGVLATRPR